AMLDESGGITRYLGPARGRLAGPTPALAAQLTSFPNPFNPKTTLRFALAEPARIELAIYDARGRLLVRLATGELPAGEHSLDWDGRDAAGRALPSGQYFARLLQSGQPAEERKLVLIR
ncbi:T9SS type A sorting domain-containing protein, partial [bacterium]|nr:T9SS type A sorting domain-containing protein [bacterium]